MKNWKRGAALLAALGLSLNLLGCGSSTPSGVQQSSPEQGTPPPVAEEVEPEEVVEPEPEPAPAPEPEPLTGVVAASRTFPSTNGRYTISVYCFDPDTGRETQISNFSLVQDEMVENYCLSAWGLLDEMHLIFSQDYTKLKGTKQFTDRADRHAGWFDTEGNFFDVIEALGWEAKGDFDDPVFYTSVGFCGNLFVFTQWGPPSSKITGPLEWYYVPADDVTPETVQIGNAFAIDRPYEIVDNDANKGACTISVPYSKDSDTYKHFGISNVTSWIDSTHCIVNEFYGVRNENITSMILDTEAKTLTSYIPGESRQNWNGFVSPDGTRIAFMSEPLSGSNTTTGLYIVPVEGGTPVEATGYSFSLASRRTGSGNKGTYFIIGWI